MGWFPVFEDLATEVAVPLDILKIVVGFVVVLILSPLYRLVTTRAYRHTLSILIGTLLLFFMLEEIGYFVMAGIVISYVLMANLPHPFIVSVITSTIMLLICHCYRFIVSYVEWKVDCSVYVMVLVTKLTYYAKWIEKQPKRDGSFWEYMAYNLFFPSLLAGPTFSYEVFLQFMERPSHNKPLKFNLLKAIKPLLIGLPAAAITVYCMPIFTPTWVLDNEFYLSLPFWQKILLLNPIGFLYRQKYYTAWYIAQASINLSGISQSEQGKYDKMSVVSIMFQFEPNPKKKTEYWNSSFQVWLRDVVYASLATKMNSTWSLFLTFFVSAFWHGLYLTYYLLFALWAVMVFVTKWCFKWSLVFPKWLNNSYLFQFVTIVISFSLFSTIGMIGAVMAWEQSLLYLADIQYFPFVVLGLALIVSFVAKPPKVKKEIKKDQTNMSQVRQYEVWRDQAKKDQAKKE